MPALWSIADGRPVRLDARREFLEVDLETWVETTPSLAFEGLSWVGRQVVLPDRSKLDLVGVTPQGQLVVAELKRGPLSIATLAQALRYVLVMASMDPEQVLERFNRLTDETRELLQASVETEGRFDFQVLLIGTAAAPDLARATEWLEARGFDTPIRTVAFSTFMDRDGGVYLPRDVEDHGDLTTDETPRQRSNRAARTEWVVQRARELGVASVFEEAIRKASDLGLNIKPWPKSITIVPPFTRGRTLLYLSPKDHGLVGVGFSDENLIDLYGATDSEIAAALAENWVDVDLPEAHERLERFVELMTSLLARANDEEAQP